MQARDAFAPFASQVAFVEPTITSGAGNDGSEQNGDVVDCYNAHNLAFVVALEAVLDEGETAILQLTLQHGDLSGGGDMADVDARQQPEGAAASAVLTLTGGSGGSTERGTYKFDVLDSPGLKRYRRLQYELTLSRGATDTGTVAGVALLDSVIAPPA